MVLWCFNVTVPDPDLLRCYQGSETTTNQKRGGLQSLVASFPLPPFWCCLLRPLLTVLPPALSSISVSSRRSSPGGWPNTERQVAKAARSPPAGGVGPPGVAGALVQFCLLRPNEEGRASFLFLFLFFLPFSGKGTPASLLPPLTWQAFS